MLEMLRKSGINHQAVLENKVKIQGGGGGGGANMAQIHLAVS